MTDSNVHLIPSCPVPTSGERFQVTYRLKGSEAEARALAREICVEQTIEFPEDLVPEGDIRSQIIGQLVSFAPCDREHCQAVISFAIEDVGGDVVQFLNTIFGNSSLKPGIRVERLELGPALLRCFKGPRFGRQGLRELLGVPRRPLLCTALKPLGLPARELADQARQFAVGGIDLIKDDHGLANQSFAPFRERCQRCAEAVRKANGETGQRCVYAPNVTGPADQVFANAVFAKQAGAEALLVAPGLVGWDAMRRLAEADEVGLPILAHPTLLGSFVTCPDAGISHYALFGQLARLTGADASIFPSYGGRFSFSADECASIARGTSDRFGDLRQIFPAPAGGMSVARVPEMINFYGRDVVLLIGGNLHRAGPDLVDNARVFREAAAWV